MLWLVSMKFYRRWCKTPSPPVVQRNKRPSANWVNPQLTIAFSVAIWLFTVMDTKITYIIKNQIKNLPSWFWIAANINSQQHNYLLKLGSPFRAGFIIISVNLISSLECVPSQQSMLDEYFNLVCPLKRFRCRNSIIYKNHRNLFQQINYNASVPFFIYEILLHSCK